MNPLDISELSNGLILIIYNKYDDKLPQLTNVSLFVKLGSVDEILPCDRGIPNLLRQYIEKVYCPSLYTESTKLLTAYSGDAYNKIELAQVLSNINKINTKITIDSNLFSEIKEICSQSTNNKNYIFDNKIYNKTIQKFYGKYNISKLAHGTKENLDNITITRFREYIRTYYKPQNYLLFISTANHKIKIKDIEDYLIQYTPNIIKKTRSFTTYIPRYKEEMYITENWQLLKDKKEKFKIKGKYIVSILFPIYDDVSLKYPLLISIESTRFMSFLFKKIIERVIAKNNLENSVLSISTKYEKLRHICLLNVIIQTKNNIRTTKNVIQHIFRHRVSTIEAESIIQEFKLENFHYSLYDYNKEIAETYTILTENNKLIPSIPHVMQFIDDPNIISELSNLILSHGCSIYIIS